MIGYPISYQDLAALVTQEKSTWLSRAADRTNNFRKQGKYSESSNIWNEIKSVYMRLQGDCKCAYCERKLEAETRGRIEQDVEHFRPKGNIKTWEPSSSLRRQGIVPTTAPVQGTGYYLLVYHLFNYAAACKPCNSILKNSFFPIAGTYNLAGDNPVNLMAEKPYLIYPIGDFEQLPENLIRFHGVFPQPVATSGYERNRALVTIEFFELDNVTNRKNLIRERVMIIQVLFPQLENLANGMTGSGRDMAKKIIDLCQSPKSPHANCARSFVVLYTHDRSQAKEIFNAAMDLLESIS